MVLRSNIATVKHNLQVKTRAIDSIDTRISRPPITIDGNPRGHGIAVIRPRLETIYQNCRDAKLIAQAAPASVAEFLETH